MAASLCTCGRVAIYRRTGECRGCYIRRHRRENPEYAERSRAASRAWKERHREINRARDREYAKETRYDLCECGCRKMNDAAKCRACYLAVAEQRANDTVEMYEAGVPLKEIAAVLDTTLNALGVDLDRLRKAGRIGYRYARYAERTA